MAALTDNQPQISLVGPPDTRDLAMGGYTIDPVPAEESILEKKEREKLKKQELKRKKQEDAYWNSMITRKEAVQMANEIARKATQEYDNNIRQSMTSLYIQNKTMLQVLIDNNLTTMPDIEKLAEDLYTELTTPKVVETGVTPLTESSEGPLQDVSDKQ